MFTSTVLYDKLIHDGRVTLGYSRSSILTPGQVNLRPTPSSPPVASAMLLKTLQRFSRRQYVVGALLLLLFLSVRRSLFFRFSPGVFTWYSPSVSYHALRSLFGSPPRSSSDTAAPPSCGCSCCFPSRSSSRGSRASSSTTASRTSRRSNVYCNAQADRLVYVVAATERLSRWRTASSRASSPSA